MGRSLFEKRKVYIKKSESFESWDVSFSDFYCMCFTAFFHKALQVEETLFLQTTATILQ